MKKPSNQSRIGVMSVVHEGKRPFGMQTYFFEDMVKSVLHLQNDIFFFSPLKWDINSNTTPGYKFVDQKWIEVEDKIPNIIYDRSFSSHKAQKPIIENCRQHLNLSARTILNPFELANLLNDKVKFHSFLIENNIPTINTFPVHTLKSEKFYKTMDGKQFYLKPTFGSKGQGIFVVQNNLSGYTLFDSLGKATQFSKYGDCLAYLSNAIGKEAYFVQEAAKTLNYNNAPFDIRVLVQNYGNDYKVTGKAVRIGQESSMTSNLNSGGHAIPLDEMKDFFNMGYNFDVSEVEDKIETICLNCADKLRQKFGDFCEIGFDILVTEDNGPIIIEGNAKPSRWVFVKIADYLESKGKDNSFYVNSRNETVSVPMKYAAYLMGKK